MQLQSSGHYDSWSCMLVQLIHAYGCVTRHFSENVSVARVQSATSWLEVSEMAEKNVEVPEEVPALKKASSRGSHSSFWEHFSDPTADKRTTYKHCKGSYKYTGGTTNLINHLKSSHPAFVGGNSILSKR